MANPKTRSCACMQSFYRLCDLDPKFRTRQVKLDDSTRKRMSQGRLAAKRPVRVIPVVVHVIHRTAYEKISMSQIKSQIKVLNQDFRAQNTDVSNVPSVWSGLVADARVEFVLASKDPNGNRTNGVNYVSTSVREFSSDDEMKNASTGGADAWNTSKFLNIWVCTLGNNLLGYAQFPGGPKKTDGVVILNTAFGTNGTATAPFDKGRTTTHEIGHFLNLRHIWGDVNGCTGTDFVSDTPNAISPNLGQPTFPHITCSNGPNGDMFMNYMDYVNDDAMFMFTVGQVERMDAALTGPRKSLGKPKSKKTKKKQKNRKT